MVARLARTRSRRRRVDDAATPSRSKPPMPRAFAEWVGLRARLVAGGAAARTPSGIAQPPVPHHARPGARRARRGRRRRPGRRSKARSPASTTSSPPKRRAAAVTPSALCRHLLAPCGARGCAAWAICRSTRATTPARRIYRRLGFVDGYAYHYRTPPTARLSADAAARGRSPRRGRGARSSTAPRRRSRPCRGCRAGHQQRLRRRCANTNRSTRLRVVAGLDVEVAVGEHRRVAQRHDADEALAGVALARAPRAAARRSVPRFERRQVQRHATDRPLRKLPTIGMKTGARLEPAVHRHLGQVLVRRASSAYGRGDASARVAAGFVLLDHLLAAAGVAGDRGRAEQRRRATPGRHRPAAASAG